MSKVRGKKMKLPMVPLAGRPSSGREAFWLQQSNSGAINAFRQLTTSRHKGGRKRISLPGGKLKPLFKNYTLPRRADGGGFSVLPGITGPPVDTGSVLQQVICGSLDNLPPKQPTTARIYLASNYEDMKIERHMLLKNAVPQLQTFCSKQGLHFQLVDLCWGMPENPHGIDGNTRCLRQQEIKDCQQLSLGSQFVVLVGDRSGQRLLPDFLTEEVYSVLMTSAAEKDIMHKDLLNQFYICDENAVPQVYRLQVLESHSFEDLLSLLKAVYRAAELALETGKIDHAQLRHMTATALEEDIEQGIFETADPRSHCLCYHREWREFSPSRSTSSAETYFDLSCDEDNKLGIAADSRSRHQTLISSIKKHLGAANYKCYYLKWSDRSDIQADADFALYLHTLCQDFVDNIKHQIMQGLALMKKSLLFQKPVYAEALFNAHMCCRKASGFIGRAVLLFRVEKFLKDPRQRSIPFFIHGAPGSGKTAAISQIAKMIHVWFPGEHVMVVRFLGTTSDSCHIHQTIISITEQISLAYGLKMPHRYHDMGTLFKALTKFRQVIENVSTNYASIRPLFILLDGINNLQPMNEQLHALWAIKEFPSNVHMIASFTTMVGKVNLLQTIVPMAGHESACHELEELEDSLIAEMIQNHMNAINRKLTEEQTNAIMDMYKSKKSINNVQIILSSASKWSSNMIVEDLQLRSSPEAAFIKAINRIEDNYGQVYAKYLLSYITASGIGIQERELIDVLTCNLTVNTELRQLLQLPDDIHCLPSFVWTETKLELQDFLQEHSIFSKVVLGWSQNLYMEVIADKYGTIYPGIDEGKIMNDGTELTLTLHEDMANRYLEKAPELDGFVAGSISSPDESLPIIITSPQPLNSTNVIKLHLLPGHFYILLPVDGPQEVKMNMFFNYQWLLFKLTATSIPALYKDLLPIISLARYFEQEEVFEEENIIHDFEVLFEFLQLSAAAFLADPLNLKNEVLARLSNFTSRSDYIANLVNGARKQSEEDAGKQILPLYPCLTQPGSMVRHVLAGPSHIIGFIHEGQFVVTFEENRGVEVWKVETGEQFFRYPVNSEQPVGGIIPTSNSEFVIICHYSHVRHVMELNVWSTVSGVCVINSTFPHEFEAFALDQDDKLIMVSTLTDVDVALGMTQRCLLGIDSTSRDILYTLVVNGAHVEGIDQIHFVRGVRQGLNGLVTIGSKMSKDLAYWDLETEEMDYVIDLGCHANLTEINMGAKIALCLSASSGILLVVDLAQGVIRHKSDARDAFTGVYSMYLSEQGRHALFASPKQGVIVYSIEKGSILRTIGDTPSTGISERQRVPTQVIMDAAECFVFVGYQTGEVKIYLIHDGTLVTQLAEHDAAVVSLIYSQNGRLLSTAEDGIMNVYNILQTLEAYLFSLGEEVLPEMDGIVQFEQSKVVPRTPCNSSEDDVTFPSSQHNVTSHALTDEGKLVYTSSALGEMCTWSTSTGQLERKLEGPAISDLYLASRDTLLVRHVDLAGSTRARQLAVCKADSGEELTIAESTMVYASCPIPLTEALFTISPSVKNNKSGVVLGIFDTSERKSLHNLHCNIYGHMDYSNLRIIGITWAQKAFTEESHEEDDCKQYVLVDYFPQEDNSYFFTFAISMKTHEILMENHDPMHIDTCSPNCTVLFGEENVLSGTVDGSLVLWNLRTQLIEDNFQDSSLEKMNLSHDVQSLNVSGMAAHEGKVTCLSLSLSQHHLVSGSEDCKIKVWSLKQKELSSVLIGHTGTIQCVNFSPDGSLVLSGSSDQTISMWKWETGEKLCGFYIHHDVMSIALTAPHDRIIARLNKGKKSQLVILNAINL